LEEFNEAVKLQPDNFKAWANLGVAFEKLGYYNESIMALEKFIKIKKYHKNSSLFLIFFDSRFANNPFASCQHHPSSCSFFDFYVVKYGQYIEQKDRFQH
ncbi:tetratricopeptide repeat protein, partial [bacterium]|nr:tetratricopeptide repeat protein [bacterium]